MSEKKQYDNKTRYHIKRLALSSLLCAFALIIFTVEAQLPAPFPVPGMKLGLANVITLFSMLYLTPKEAFSILICRIILGGLFSPNPTVIFYSMSGGMLSYCGEMLLLKIIKKTHKSCASYIIEVSIIGAMLHNAGQILCACFTLQTSAVFYYLPPLLISGALTGAICGICIWGIDKKIGSDIIKLLNDNN